MGDTGSTLQAPGTGVREALLRFSGVTPGDRVLALVGSSGPVPATTAVRDLAGTVSAALADPGATPRSFEGVLSVVTDPHRLSFLDDCFRLVLFDFSMAEVASPVIAFRESRRVLVPSGTLLVFTFPPDARRVPDGAPRLQDPDEIAWMLEVAGFDHIRHEQCRVTYDELPEPCVVLRATAPIPGLTTLAPT